MTFLYECPRTVYSLGYSGSLYYLSECYPQWLSCSYFFDHSEIAKKFWNKYNRSKDLDENGKFQRPVLLLKSSLKLILTFILRAHWPPFFVTYWLFHKYSNPYLFFKMVHSILEIPLGIHNFSLWRLSNLELYQKIPSLSSCQNTFLR